MHMFSTHPPHGTSTRAQAVPSRPPEGALEALGGGEGPRAVLLAAVARGRPALPVKAAPTRAAWPPTRELVGLDVEDLLLRTDYSVQGQAPVTLAKRRGVPPGLRLPVALLLHATGASKESLAGEQAAFARRGYLAVVFDCRYHGRRSHSFMLAAGAPGAAPHAAAAAAGALPAARAGYEAALVAAWRGSGEQPFLLDNIFDAMCLIDYLCLRCAPHTVATAVAACLPACLAGKPSHCEAPATYAAK